MEDGGYYAIKGFDFQIDKTILALFDAININERVEIEQIQDLSTDDFVIQVKYKESQSFSNSKIREPVLKLIEEFLSATTSRKYVLYCHFNDQLPASHKFSKRKLDEILEIHVAKDSSDEHKKLADRINSLTHKVRGEFAKIFSLQFADSYDGQFKKVLAVIAEQNFCNSKSEALFYYGYIADYLRKIVINNSDKSQRICGRRQIINSIVDGKRRMFYTSFADYESRNKFVKFVRPFIPCISPLENNVIIVGEEYSGTAEDLAHSICLFVRSYFKNAMYNFRPPTIFIPDQHAISVKIALIQLGVIINDGFEHISFSNVLFMREAMVLRKKSGNKATDSMEKISFDARVVSLSKIEEISKFVKPDQIMYLGAKELPIWDAVPAFLVTCIHSNELNSFLKVTK